MYAYAYELLGIAHENATGCFNAYNKAVQVIIYCCNAHAQTKCDIKNPIITV